jgi:hypothetical protein
MFDRDELHGDGLLVRPDGSKLAVTVDHDRYTSQSNGMFVVIGSFNDTFLDAETVQQREREMSGLSFI